MQRVTPGKEALSAACLNPDDTKIEENSMGVLFYFIQTRQLAGSDHVYSGE